jgi:hypothetical protein
MHTQELHVSHQVKSRELRKQRRVLPSPLSSFYLGQVFRVRCSGLLSAPFGTGAALYDNKLLTAFISPLRLPGNALRRRA